MRKSNKNQVKLLKSQINSMKIWYNLNLLSWKYYSNLVLTALLFHVAKPHDPKKSRVLSSFLLIFIKGHIHIVAVILKFHHVQLHMKSNFAVLILYCELVAVNEHYSEQSSPGQGRWIDRTHCTKKKKNHLQNKRTVFFSFLPRQSCSIHREQFLRITSFLISKLT